MEAGGEAGEPRRRRVLGERGDERLALARVDAAHPPQVAVVAARLDQPRERELVQGGRAAVGEVLLVRDRVDQRGRADEPAEPQAGRERLADRADHHHAIGREPLQRADRLAVVAELGVVVVLDEDAVALARPGDRVAAAGRGEDDAGRGLVRRGEDGRAHVGAGVAQPRAVRVHGHGDGAQPGPLGDRRPVLVARVLEPELRVPGPRERLEDEVQALREAAADDHLRRLDGRAAHAAQVGGDDGAQLRPAGRVAVAGRRQRRAAPTSASAHIQSRIGKLAMSGTPLRKSTDSAGAAAATGAAGATGRAWSATRVAAPARATR